MANITKQGKLEEIFPLFDRSTIQHADEIQMDRFIDRVLYGDRAALSMHDFWTADFPMYAMDGKKAVLYVGRNKDNLIFNDIIKATKQLREKDNYFINNRADIASVRDSETTIRFLLSDLGLKGVNSEWTSFEINTEKYDNLNYAQRTLAERVYGSGRAFINTMEMLNHADIGITKIYVLNPEYVKVNVPKNGAIARGSCLDRFSDDSDFNLGSRLVDSKGRRLRGILSSSGADVLKIDAYHSVLNYSRKFVSEHSWNDYKNGLKNLLER